MPMSQMRTSRMRMRPLLMGVIAGALLLGWLVASAAAVPREGQELIGTPMRSWSELRWLGSPPGDLRGKVVLVRWWSDACPMCSGALPSLGRLYEEHQREGLVVVGIYHPKPPVPITPATLQLIQNAAKEHEARFPLATDADWTVRWEAAGRAEGGPEAACAVRGQGRSEGSMSGSGSWPSAAAAQGGKCRPMGALFALMFRPTAAHNGVASTPMPGARPSAAGRTAGARPCNA